MGKDRKERPMSRFWSCFFAGSIFALYWTLPMKKSIKWALQFVGLWMVGIGAGFVGDSNDGGKLWRRSGYLGDIVRAPGRNNYCYVPLGQRLQPRALWLREQVRVE